MFSLFVLGFLVGLAACMYLLHKQKEKAEATSVKGHKVYINFIMVNKDEGLFLLKIAWWLTYHICI